MFARRSLPPTSSEPVRSITHQEARSIRARTDDAVHTFRAPRVAPPIVHEVLRDPGEPLDARTLAVMNAYFSHDFSLVRVHTGPRAAQSAAAVAARAYTVGSHVVFGANGYRADTVDGKRQLAHELAHVVQQSGAGDGTLDVAPAGGAFERDAELAAASGRLPGLRASARQVQREGAIMQVQLSQAERATLDTYLGQHRFMPLRGGRAQLDGQEMTSAAIAQKAHDEAMSHSRVDLITKDVDRRIRDAAISSAIPQAPQYPKTTAEKIQDWFTQKPSGGEAGPQQAPPSAAPNPDDLNKTTVTPVPSDQSMLKRLGMPVAPPTKTPALPLPEPGKASHLFSYTQLMDRYAVETRISFWVTAPDGFWKRPGVKKVVLVSGAQDQPVSTWPITRDGQPVMWPVPYVPGTYTVMVTVGDQPEPGSARSIQVYKP